MPRNVKTILEEDEKKPAAPMEGAVDDENVEDDILIEDEEGEVEPKKPVDEGKKKPTAEEEATALKKQLGIERAAREDAEARAEAADKRAGTATSTAANAVQEQINAAEVAIKNKITSAKTNLDSVKQQLKQARASGDTDAEVDLQDAMTNARYELNTAEWEEKNFNSWKENQKKAASKPAAEKNASPYTDKELSWIKKHPEFKSDKKFARVTKLAAQEARDDGIKQDTAEYFQFIEDALVEQGLIEVEDDPTSGAGRNTNTSASHAASPQRDGSGDTKPAPGKNAKYPFIPSGYRISAEWVQLAKDLDFEDPREYANMRLEEEANSKNNR